VFLRFILIIALVACGGSHRHGPASHPDDPRRLYVEVVAEGSHREALEDGATAGLAGVAFAVPVRDGGDIELQVEVSRLETVGRHTQCSVKILAIRLPAHDLLGIADGAGRAAGTIDDAEDACVQSVGEALVRGKLRGLLRRQLSAKR
jgi:hypothetical protein